RGSGGGGGFCRSPWGGCWGPSAGCCAMATGAAHANAITTATRRIHLWLISTSPYRFSRLGRNDFSSLAFSFSCGSDLNKPSLGELKRSEVGDCQLAIALASLVNC